MWSLLTRRVIHSLSGEPYLVRWTLVSTPWFSVKVHHILLRTQLGWIDWRDYVDVARGREDLC